MHLAERALNAHSKIMNTPQRDMRKDGLWAGIAAYLMWGLFPIYFKNTTEVGAIEILAHRILWSVPLGLLIIAARRQFPDVWKAVKNPKTLMLLSLAAMALAVNWGVYIWAIQIDQIFQGSLGYYINPLLFVLIGVVFFGERLTRLQSLAVLLAAIGVAVLSVYGGQFPGIALILAVSFGLYGIIRKQVNVGAMPGLMIESIVLLPAAIGYLIYLGHTGTIVFGPAPNHGGLNISLLMIAAGPLTVLPLLCFAVAARKLKLSTLGFLQFIGPTMQFLCGVYYGEAFTRAHAICFAFIWAAVLIFMWDGLRKKPLPS